MGRPQPLNTFEQNAPFFEPRISKAIRIQRVVLPVKQQFIKTSCVSPQGICISISCKRICACGFVFLLHNILSMRFLCNFLWGIKRKNEKVSLILLRKI